MSRRFRVSVDRAMLSEHRTFERAQQTQEREVSRQRHHMETRARAGERVIQGACSRETLPPEGAACTAVVLFSFEHGVMMERHVTIMPLEEVF